MYGHHGTAGAQTVYPSMGNTTTALLVGCVPFPPEAFNRTATAKRASRLSLALTLRSSPPTPPPTRRLPPARFPPTYHTHTHTHTHTSTQPHPAHTNRHRAGRNNARRSAQARESAVSTSAQRASMPRRRAAIVPAPTAAAARASARPATPEPNTRASSSSSRDRRWSGRKPPPRSCAMSPREDCADQSINSYCDKD